uniref:Uncharacterized protein n=1 Tax=Candidatus Kentrum sp. LFY TaxID=2126342 RepID=A0A450UPI7_9GAMM|nr:MAG: hypothetical protein BECKLFY1418A_GA0070994_100711 [Candidatus Kentron sp. LFY]VFJ94429.1 MAG: hypothetical protein BECKLFY1418B_GA0070995_10587 [Candidatus Kentron sp. LFY]
MEFEWDERKAHINEAKHGISFYEATEVFGDSYSSCVPDPDHSHDEERYLLFGISERRKYLVVSFTQNSNKLRIISARHMTRQERKAYEQ